MSDIREKIKKYLQSKKKLDEVARYVYIKNKNIHDAAKSYGVIYTHLQQKVDIIKRLLNDFKLGCALHRAVQNVLNAKESIGEAAIHYKLDPKILSREIQQYKDTGKKLYIYNKPVDVNTGIFTFDEELLLLKRLSQRKMRSLFCACQICTMEVLLSLAYEFAQEKKKRYPETWNKYKRADEKWLIKFEMIHSIKLSIMFPSKCKKE
ncbi:uncharacterized protein LOC126852600 [Cataglyphis hispanica]|uniref:uncharacterized protein LOC126852600 n=1 Tax=Cataglyphis hispanica TaxID=1086592 RepID=UPI00217FF985|nr:uncharacterized protein LOC126852600 [Cataglyphis hispanica]XP_050453521.1 uncharacterized protein LOC126852600 [Cataglyphis hispanica]